MSVILAINSFSQSVINLAGTWNVKLDQDNIGIEQEWFKSVSSLEKVTLPGCIQEQGFGEIPSPNTIWWSGNNLKGWFASRPWIKKYNTDATFKTQAFLIPDRYYLGAVWYTKEIEIPEDWSGTHPTLFLERCHWESKLWVDGKFYGSQLSLATPHKYNLNRLKPGKHKIVLRIDNSNKVDLGPRAHSTSDQTAGTWNGIIGKIELRKQNNVCIHEVRTFPNIEAKHVNVEVTLAGLKQFNDAKWSIKIQAKGYNGNTHNPKPLTASGVITNDTILTTNLIYPLGKKMKLWDEFNPNLYRLSLNLTITHKGKEYKHNYEQSFGVKEFKVSGSQFSMNGIKTFLRGNVDCAVMPKTGYTPADITSWKKIWKTYKDFGLNMARFHSWCPPRAAFIAADEIGIYLAPEVGEWTTVNKESQLKFFLEESKRILETYGNHASFIQMGLGNERGGKSTLFKTLLDKWKTWDSRHLYTIKANANYANKGFANKGADFEVLRKSGKEPSFPVRYQSGWPPKPENSAFINRAPQTILNWKMAVDVEKTPIIQHETAQICAYPNIKEELPKYTGYLKPTYLEIAKEQLQSRGMYHQINDFVEASGRWQVALTREEMEAAYRTPGLAGFHWLGLSDFTGQDTAPIGFTDAFYDTKSYVDVEQVKQWNGPTVLLAAMPKRILTALQDFKADILISHFGKENLKIQVCAQLKDAYGTILKKWKIPQKSITQGSGQKLGEIAVDSLSIDKASHLILEIESADKKFKNAYDLWVFPEIEKQKIPKDILVAKVWNAHIESQLKKGVTVLLLPEQKDLKDNLPSCFTNHYWTSFGKNKGQSSATGVLFDTFHPIFKNFPTKKYVNWQWWDVLTHAHPMVIDTYNSKFPWPKDYKSPLQPIDTWKINRKLALLIETKVGKGKLIICSIDIETNLEDRPVTKLLRHNLINYITSSAFSPKEAVQIEGIKEIFNLKHQ